MYLSLRDLARDARQANDRANIRSNKCAERRLRWRIAYATSSWQLWHSLDPTSGFCCEQVNLNRRGVLATFKSKSLDLLGTSRILPPQQHNHHHHGRHRMADDQSPGRNAAADRRRRLFRRKKANSASGSYDDSPSGSQQSRSSSVESNQSSAHVIHRGLESALKTSTLFAWSSVEASAANQHLLSQTNQPSFIERESFFLHTGYFSIILSNPHAVVPHRLARCAR